MVLKNTEVTVSLPTTNAGEDIIHNVGTEDRIQVSTLVSSSRRRVTQGK